MDLHSLMVHMTAGVSSDQLLKFTVDLATRLGARKVIGIVACQPLQLYAEPTTYVPQYLIDRDRAEIDKQMREAEERFRYHFEGTGPALEWRSTVGFVPLADYIAHELRAADLLVTAPDPGPPLLDNTRRLATADLVMTAGRPVLIVDAATERLDLENVLVGWKDTREARRAILDALPFLKLARHVTVVEVTTDRELPEAHKRIDDVAGWLKVHGVAASGRAVASIDDDAAMVKVMAADLDAGLLVGGAYGHDRLREWVFGGVTRELLLRPPRCALVSH